MSPDFSLEQTYNGLIAGVDEAGRGPWAGPVVAAAVIMDRTLVPAGINDSKKISARKREQLFRELQQCTRWGIGIANVEEIDSLNILQATKLAMQRAVDALPLMPDVVLVDGNSAPLLSCKTETVIKGDSKSLSIAAASILAKVTRDRLMTLLAAEYPYYGWEKNAGYGTAFHQQTLQLHGVSPHHRKSFAPVRALLEEVIVAADA